MYALLILFTVLGPSGDNEIEIEASVTRMQLLDPSVAAVMQTGKGEHEGMLSTTVGPEEDKHAGKIQASNYYCKYLKCAPKHDQVPTAWCRHDKGLNNQFIHTCIYMHQETTTAWTSITVLLKSLIYSKIGRGIPPNLLILADTAS